VSESAAVTSGFRGYAYGLGALNPTLRRKYKVVAASLSSKPLEFERFKIRIAQLFPKPKKLDGAAAAHPIVDDGKRLLRVPISRDVSQ
jgi:hypothetical protein